MKRIYKPLAKFLADIFNYVEVFYNLDRRNSHLGGVFEGLRTGLVVRTGSVY